MPHNGLERQVWPVLITMTAALMVAVLVLAFLAIGEKSDRRQVPAH